MRIEKTKEGDILIEKARDGRYFDRKTWVQTWESQYFDIKEEKK